MKDLFHRLLYVPLNNTVLVSENRNGIRIEISSTIANQTKIRPSATPHMAISNNIEGNIPNNPNINPIAISFKYQAGATLNTS
ncbi:hypothetical protein D3C76_1617680 [compost metagenome]